jgi:hypothetical protein
MLLRPDEDIILTPIQRCGLPWVTWACRNLHLTRQHSARQSGLTNKAIQIACQVRMIHLPNYAFTMQRGSGTIADQVIKLLASLRSSASDK